MALILTEGDVGALLDMKGAVAAVEEAFMLQGRGQAANSPRTRSRGEGSVLNVMHASSQYLGRGGVKAYMSSKAGTKFVVLLFDLGTSELLAVMGADLLGRFRTGAASGVATKHLYKGGSCALALLGSGKQALTQALAVREVLKVDSVRVWSPNGARREKFAALLSEHGFSAGPSDSPDSALKGAQVATAVTSSKDPFLTGEMLAGVSHLNLCGGNVPGHSEIVPSALSAYGAVVVDDLQQARVEYGDLIQGARAGTFDWESAVELGAVLSGKAAPEGRTLFKSGGVAMEDVAVASLVYDRAVKSGNSYPQVDFV